MGLKAVLKACDLLHIITVSYVDLNLSISNVTYILKHKERYAFIVC